MILDKLKKNKKIGLKLEEEILWNQHTYNFYFEQLFNIAISSIRWHNLPDTMDERFLEYVLNINGQTLLFEDEVIGKINTMCTGLGQWNIYDIPTERTAYASTGYYRMLSERDSVIVYNNFMHTSTIPALEMFAQKLYLCERTIDINIHAQKTPVLVKGTEKQMFSLKNLYKKWTAFAPVIYGDKNLETTKMEVLKTDAPFISDKILQIKNQYWEQALAYLGVSANEQQKRERMITSEISSSMGSMAAQRQVRLRAREQGADQFNRMFKTDIYPTFDEEILKSMLESELFMNDQEKPEEEGKDNEQI